MNTFKVVPLSKIPCTPLKSQVLPFGKAEVKITVSLSLPSFFTLCSSPTILLFHGGLWLVYGKVVSILGAGGHTIALGNTVTYFV